MMFSSFFMGGFECASHRRQDGRRLDILAASGHDRMAREDYDRLASNGIRAARDGVRWYLIERSPGDYDWSSFLPMLKASRAAGIDVVWDLCHYGWPDDIDIWTPDFIDRFARFAGALARLVREEAGEEAFFCPVNEMSFWAWAGGEAGKINPCTRGRGGELKRQLVRASIAAIDSVRDALPRARFVYAEPAIHVDGGLGSKKHRAAAENYRLSQFEALDMISGRMEPELGGSPDYLDVVGVNFYPDNQWYLGGNTIPLGHHAYRPFRTMLEETYRRYGRPMIVSETGAEGTARPAWLHYVMGEVIAARQAGVEIGAVCLYPVVDCPGWDNDRACPVGLFSEADAAGDRRVYEPLAMEVMRQEELLLRIDATTMRQETGKGAARLPVEA